MRAGAFRMFHRELRGPAGAADATPYVLVHGFVISHRYHVPLARLLSRSRRVLLPDLPGFGRSSKPRDALDIDGLAAALADWMRAVGVPRAIVVGNSMGCQVAAALAEREPHLVERLALIGPTVDPAARTMPRQVALLLRDMVEERPSLPWLHVPDYARCGPRRILQTARHALRDRIEERDVRVPTLVLRGDRDALVSEAFARELARRWPLASYETLADSPHAANYSAPEAAAEAIERSARERDPSEKGLEAPAPPRSIWTRFTTRTGTG